MTATTSIPLGALPALDRTRRDQWGRYLVRPPFDDAEKPVGYTRATTVATALDDGYGLQKWLATMAICGAMMRPGLRAQWEALMATHAGDPWYASDEAKRDCKRLVDECAAVGGANDRSEIGTALHEITAMFDAGRTPTHLSPETERDLTVYADTLAAANIVLDPDLIETTVVLDEPRVAGTFDRGARVPGFAKPLIADLKTGGDLSFSWHSIAVQVAIYAHGDAIYRQGPAEDGSGDVREPMPDVDRDNGLIIWLPAGTGECELFLVDLTAGWEAFQRSMWVREWRKRDVFMVLGEGHWRPATNDLTPALEASLEALGVEPPTDDPEPKPVDHTTQLRDWLQSRIDTIGAKSPEARADLARSWPEKMPALRTNTDHTPEDLATIDHVLSQVEKRHRITFPEPRPGGEDVALVIRMFPTDTDNSEEQTK